MTNELPDNLNPDFALQALEQALLLRFATGELNAQEYIEREMADRGIDKDGKWVGFDEAEKIWRTASREKLNERQERQYKKSRIK